MISWLLATTLMLASPSVGASGSPSAVRTHLDVPVVKQTPQRCGQAALEMVLRYYGAGPEALKEPARAFDPILRGSLITDLAAAARRAGYDAEIATLTPDSLVALLAADVPPIVLYQNGPPPFTVAHFGVIRGWDADRKTLSVNDGEAAAKTLQLSDFAKRWRTAGSQALIIRRVRS